MAKKIYSLSEDQNKIISNMIFRDADFSEIAEGLNEYCPFSALKVSDYEIRHANFLADILDPMKPHGFGDLILRRVLEVLLCEAGKYDLLESLHKRDLYKVCVEREKKRIDLLIILPEFGERNKKLMLAFEIKIHSKEANNQLQRYNNDINDDYCDDKFDKILFFTTINGDTASSDGWISVEFGVIVDAISQALSGYKGNSLACQMTRKYVDLYNTRILGDHNWGDQISRLWSNYDDVLKLLKKSSGKNCDGLDEKYGLKNSNALKFLIKNNWSIHHEISNKIRSKEFLLELNNNIKNNPKFSRELILEINQFTKGHKYTSYRVEQWADIDFIKSNNGQSNQLISLGVDILEYGVYVKLEIGSVSENDRDKDLKSREKLYSKLKDIMNRRGSGNPHGNWTRIISKNVYRSEDLLELNNNYYSDSAKYNSMLNYLLRKISEELIDIALRADEKIRPS